MHIYWEKKFLSLDKETYEDLVRDAIIIKAKDGRPLILRQSNLIIKHFYGRGFWTSAWVWPDPLRFERNTKLLARLGFGSPLIQDKFSYKHGKCYVVTYQYIAGKAFNDLYTKKDCIELTKVAKFAADLHRVGVFHRDLHLENIIVKSDGTFVLIDSIRVMFKKRALSLKRRAYNLAHLLSRKEDQQIFHEYGTMNFIKQYFSDAGLDFNKLPRFLRYMQQRTPGLGPYLT